MEFRLRRQLIVVAILLAFLGGIGYFIAETIIPDATCHDNIRNQGEEDVDCGGPCTPCALKQQKDPEVFWIRPAKVREGSYDVVARIRNPNTKLGAPVLAYEMTLLDAADLPLDSRRGTSFLYPGETVHLAEFGLRAERPPQRAEIHFQKIDWVLTDEIAPDLIAGAKTHLVEDADGAVRSALEATIVNRTLRDLPEIIITAVLSDQAENFLAAHRTLIDRIPAGESHPVKLVWPGVIPGTVFSLAIEARTRALLPQASP